MNCDLVKYAINAGAELFHCDDTAFATVPVENHRETWPIASRGFRKWLRRNVYGQCGSPPSATDLSSAIELLSAIAAYHCPAIPVAVRVAEHKGAVYLDLADSDCRVVEITPQGWRVTPDPPVRFLRKPGMVALPAPVRGGSVDELRRFLNVGSDHDWALLSSWLAAAFYPKGPYAILIVVGEQGSAKSTACRLLRALIDPNAAPVRAEPRSTRDLMIAANNAFIVAFDNLSAISPRLADALCQLSTGGSFGTRALYTNDDERLFDATCPIILNGIEIPTARADLLDRSISVALPPLPEDRRQTEAELWAAFYEARPRILGGLLDAVSAGLRNHNSVRLERLPRMADFAIRAVACEAALGLPPGAFLAAYTRNRDTVVNEAIESSAIGPSILALVGTCSSWCGGVKELLDLLEEDRFSDQRTRRQPDWPKSARALGGQLRRLAADLRRMGVDVRFLPRTRSGIRVSLQKLGQASASTASCVPSPMANQNGTGVDAGAGSNREGGADDDTGPHPHAPPFRSPEKGPDIKGEHSAHEVLVGAAEEGIDTN